jgi:signal transduction histidine kinase
MVSHELKTPLTSLNAYIQMMQTKAEKLNDPFFGSGLMKVNKQVKRMSAMINGFLNLSRLESAKIQIIRQAFDLNQLLKEMVEENEFILPNHPIVLHARDTIIIHADRDKIGSVISNLIGNAGKYSTKGKTITVSSEITDGFVKVSVKDQGVGIKPEDREKLFERFYRVDNPNHKHVSGFGIGLYLSAEIINRHDGKIWVESQLNEGSTFHFLLPLSNAGPDETGATNLVSDRSI